MCQDLLKKTFYVSPVVKGHQQQNRCIFPPLMLNFQMHEVLIVQAASLENVALLSWHLVDFKNLPRSDGISNSTPLTLRKSRKIYKYESIKTQ